MPGGNGGEEKDEGVGVSTVVEKEVSSLATSLFIDPSVCAIRSPPPSILLVICIFIFCPIHVPRK